VRLFLDKHLDKNTKFCYTYDELSRVTKRTAKDLNNNVLSEETFTYDAAGNITDAPESCFQYDTNNRLIIFNGNAVSYDLDGNMLSNGSLSCTYDSANRLVSAGGHTYTYNAEDVRIRNLCACEDTTYTYDVNSKLNKLLCKTTNGVTTKYVYGRGLIGEETSGTFKTYHFDFRGSTIAITDSNGTITDTFAYDTYGKLISRTGTSNVIFGYNGRDGVVADNNGLIYMRARYYSPDMKRFVNADIVAGKLSNAITLNRFAYANGNPVSFVDPFGLSPERGDSSDQVILAIDEILGDINSVTDIYGAYGDIIKLLETSYPDCTFKLDKKYTLFKLLGAEVYWEIATFQGDGDLEIKYSNLKDMLNSNDVKEFLDSAELSKVGIYSNEMTFKYDEHTTIQLSASGDVNVLTRAATTKIEISITQTDGENYMVNTFGVEKTWNSSNPTKPNGEGKSDDVKQEIPVGASENTQTNNATARSSWLNWNNRSAIGIDPSLAALAFGAGALLGGGGYTPLNGGRSYAFC